MSTTSNGESNTGQMPKWLQDLARTRLPSSTPSSTSNSSNSSPKVPYKLLDYPSLEPTDYPKPTRTSRRFSDKPLTFDKPSNLARHGRRSARMRPDDFDLNLNTFRDSSVLDDGSKRGGVLNEYDFVIPEFPYGKFFEINIKTTWGDKHYVGLNGVEIFTDTGQLVDVEEIRANPSDVNDLPENENDPRVVSNLIDGVNRTKEDHHIWLAPFQPGARHLIHITFTQPQRIAMIRIWNYNKSRIHSYRGARSIEMTLDNRYIFQGEIAKAKGGITSSMSGYGDTILFTTNEDVLEAISKNDAYFQLLMSPDTDEGFSTLERPLTAASQNIEPFDRRMKRCETLTTSLAVTNESDHLEIVLLDNWGHKKWMGLTAIQVMDGVRPVDVERIVASPGRDVVNILIDGSHVTTDLEHMLVMDLQPITLHVYFGKVEKFSALKIWNLNAPHETYAGVKTVKILVDNHPIRNASNHSDVFTIRRAPGHVHYDYGQTILLDGSREISAPRALNDGTQKYPNGFIYELLILSTHGDNYYVGLTGIELYDQDGILILLTEDNVACQPNSINVLEGIAGDIRTPDKLIDGIHIPDGTHSWLSPILPGQLTRVYVIFDTPQTISAVKVWNYGKTPSRGAKDVALMVDDLLVCHASLDVWNERGTIVRLDRNGDSLSNDLGVSLMDNDTRVTTRGELFDDVDHAQRPFTSIAGYR